MVVLCYEVVVCGVGMFDVVGDWFVVVELIEDVGFG